MHRWLRGRSIWSLIDLPWKLAPWTKTLTQLLTGATATVSTLATVVGHPKTPMSAGNGGLRRGFPCLPSKDSIRAWSTHLTKWAFRSVMVLPVCMSVCICAYVCLCICLHACVCIHKHVCVCTVVLCTRVCVCALVYIYMSLWQKVLPLNPGMFVYYLFSSYYSYTKLWLLLFSMHWWVVKVKIGSFGHQEKDF